MARLVKKENKGPLEVKVGRKSIWICMCGLGNNQPFCDESHKKTADEDNKFMYTKMKATTELKLRIGKNVTTTLDNLSK